MSVLITIAAFIVAIGVLVTIHELGHYWAARHCDVKILRFSIGFGRPLWLTRRGSDQTEWVIAALGCVCVRAVGSGIVRLFSAFSLSREPCGS